MVILLIGHLLNASFKILRTKPSIFPLLGAGMERTAASTLSANIIIAASFVCGLGPG